MSWDSYVSEQLVGTGNVLKAAICGQDGQVWAASAGFTPSAEEAIKLVQAFDNPSGLASGGMNIAGTRFVYLSGTDEVLRGKKGTQGVHVAKTKTAIIIAVYEDPIQPGQCAVTVENLADYLKGVNY